MNYVPGSTDPATNSRFADLGANTNSEMLAPMTQLIWNPVSGETAVSFQSAPYISVANTYHQLSNNPNTLYVDLSQKLATCYGEPLGTLVDPVTGADLTKISVAGIMTLIKTAYDQEYNVKTPPGSN